MKIAYSLNEDFFPLKDTVVALGMFDGVHRGHQTVLSAALDIAKERDLTPCVFTFALAKDRPHFKQNSKVLSSKTTLARLLSQQGMEYALAPSFDEMKNFDAEHYVAKVLKEKMGAKVLCCGTNFTFAKGGNSRAQDLGEIAKRHGIEVKVLPLMVLNNTIISSTKLRNLIVEGDIKKASELLGHLYSIDFEVVSGNKIGRTLGTPTINQPFPSDFVIPRYGVYATIVTLEGQRYSAVTNVGVKPTIGSNLPLAETYIQDFSGDLYGKAVEVEFLEFIRPEKKFDGLESLKRQIAADANTAKAIAEPLISQNGLTDSQDFALNF